MSPALQSKRTSVTLLNDYVVLGSLGKGAYGGRPPPCLVLCAARRQGAGAHRVLQLAPGPAVAPSGCSPGTCSPMLTHRWGTCGPGHSAYAQTLPLDRSRPACPPLRAGSVKLCFSMSDNSLYALKVRNWRVVAWCIGRVGAGTGAGGVRWDPAAFGQLVQRPARTLGG